MNKQNLRLIKKREGKGLTQKELGERVGLTQSMIAHIESGLRDPRLEHMARLAHEFQVTVDWLFCEERFEEWLIRPDMKNNKTGENQKEPEPA